MTADRQTDRRADRNTSHPGGEVININNDITQWHIIFSLCAPDNDVQDTSLITNTNITSSNV